MENKDQLKKNSPSLKEFQNLLDQDFKDRRLKENAGKKLGTFVTFDL